MHSVAVMGAGVKIPILCQKSIERIRPRFGVTRRSPGEATGANDHPDGALAGGRRNSSDAPVGRAVERAERGCTFQCRGYAARRK
jgi:hypothetical protein